MAYRKVGKLLPHQRSLAKVIPPKKDLEKQYRKVTVQQLAVLLYHFYIGVTDPDIYYMDSDESAEKFYQRLEQEVEIDLETLEKLLWYLTAAYESDRYWNPADIPYEQFTKTVAKQGDNYNQLLSLILEKSKMRKR